VFAFLLSGGRMKRVALLVMAVVILTSASVIAQDSLWVTKIDDYNLVVGDRAGANFFTISNDIAYIADTQQGVFLMDISDPANLDTLKLFDPARSVYSLAVYENYLYVLSRVEGIIIYDLSDPANPDSLTTYETETSGERLYIDGSKAFIAARNDGLEILDLSNPLTPQLLHLFDPTVRVEDAIAVGDYVYLAQYSDGVVTLDISDPDTVIAIDTLDVGRTKSLHMSPNGYLYVAATSDGYSKIDISDPANPQIVYSYDPGGSMYSVTTYRGYVYASVGRTGFLVIDEFDPEDVQEIGYYEPDDGVEMAIEHKGLMHGLSGDFYYVFDVTGAIGAEIQLRPNYFELVSTNRIFSNMLVDSVFVDVPSIRIVQNIFGDVYIPEFEVNTIGEIDETQGYRIYADETTSWFLSGQRVDPEATVVLDDGRWHWISYPFNSAVPVEIALQEIADYVVVVMDDDGGLWVPGVVNTLGSMRTGSGYYIMTEVGVSFQFLLTAPRNIVTQPVVQVPEIEGAPQATGIPYAILVGMSDDLKTQNPSLIEVYDNKLLVGKAAVLEDNEVTPVIAWQGDDHYGLPGYKAGNSITVVVRASDGREIAKTDEAGLFGKGGYAEILLDVNDSSLPLSFSVAKAYPNPFNPSVTIPFSLPQSGEVSFTVFNTIGQQVYGETISYNAGSHRFTLNAFEHDIAMTSGVYFVQVRYGDMKNIQKIMLLK
ncbi:T9SS type A sorting domain-containing protein, partial [bacterium]|nr:T9SS type A sorting domain-containing protein [bacterium]